MEFLLLHCFFILSNFVQIFENCLKGTIFMLVKLPKVSYAKRNNNIRLSDAQNLDRLDHLGIVAGICDEIDLVKEIDRLIPSAR